MVTSLLSLALNKAVRQNMAMTGEITLTGKVLPVGGIKEKVIAARRSQVKHLILPKENQKDWRELPDYMKEGLEVHFADYYDDVFAVAFEVPPFDQRKKDEQPQRLQHEEEEEEEKGEKHATTGAMKGTKGTKAHAKTPRKKVSKQTGTADESTEAKKKKKAKADKEKQTTSTKKKKTATVRKSSGTPKTGALSTARDGGVKKKQSQTAGKKEEGLSTTSIGVHKLLGIKVEPCWFGKYMRCTFGTNANDVASSLALFFPCSSFPPNRSDPTRGGISSFHQFNLESQLNTSFSGPAHPIYISIYIYWCNVKPLIEVNCMLDAIFWFL